MMYFKAGDEPINLAIDMKLRDYFACHMMQSIYIRDNLAIGYTDVMAKDAYRLADALIKERESK